ncbi:hypothetical protein EXIGLDRAFT_234936 [Exidia glandulosa HHB12029]|uniref:BTB domain-containing protein n=1 Tax=Exidia glandulosa HHB12029 TaxID=1314781 RepID=A0A165E2N5_EXIGL|nr:hypothetical protein EXIGLDRAFT_234936 [Exidia glandulosa HHB12029]
MSTTNTATVTDLPAGTTRDDKYYWTDGNIILQAENTLFKVQRSMLTEMSPVLADLLQLPQPEGSPENEGDSDASPVKLAGDTALQFRSLMWALYSRPDEVKKYLETSELESRCCRLLDLVAITHKYQCPDLMNWALDLASEACKAVEKPSAALVTVLIHLYRLDLQGFVEWAEPAVRRGHLSDVSLIKLASASNWESVNSFAYYRIVCSGPSSWATLDLTPPERTRLLAGYINLNETWAIIDSKGPSVAHTCGASTLGLFAFGPCPAACTTVWNNICRSPRVVTVGLGNRDSTVDIQRRLAAAADLVDQACAPIPTVDISISTYWSGIACKSAFRDGVKAYSEKSEKMVQLCFDPHSAALDHVNWLSWLTTTML